MTDQVNEALRALKGQADAVMVAHATGSEDVFMLHVNKLLDAVRAIEVTAHPSRGVVDELPELPEARLLTAIGRDAYTADQMRDYARAALQAAALPAVPDGWALVPKVPTEAMTHAMAAALDFPSVYMGGPSTGSKRKAATVYAAMLAATPAHDQPEGEG